ncbi:MAG: hypothetical protein U5K56_01445 [Halioglobus sp.]|nr:hypothetical protein [Halioglobus sp.]
MAADGLQRDAIMFSVKRLVIALLAALYLYYLLPATAVAFYELYHLTEIGAIYWGYSGFKAAGYYFGTWEYRLHTCIGLAIAIVVLPAVIHKIRNIRERKHEST